MANLTGAGLTGRVAIVTGSTAGLGRGMAVMLARAGCDVVINGRDPAKGERVVAQVAEAGRQGLFVPGDVADKAFCHEIVAAAVERFGRIDILINNAQARVPYAPLEGDVMGERFTFMLQSGVHASLWTAQAAFPHFVKARYGRIVNFGSLNGVRGTRYAGPYNASKSAIEALTRTMANEWGVHGITANVVLPSGMSEAYQRFFKDDPARAERAAQGHPMRRHGDPELDIGAAVVGLVSDEAGYITGQSLCVDGGQSLIGMPQVHKPAEPAS